MQDNNYKLLIVLTLCILLISVVFNYKVYDNIKKQISVNKKIQKKYRNLSEKKVKKYTYSDIIELVEENKNFSIVNIDKDKNNNIDVELTFKGSITSFFSFINSIKYNNRFKEIIFLSLKKNSDDINNVVGRLRLGL
ncbi:hypothetical protein [Clostridium lundense]|uniref:hypothetical protein n=1 Tax=Clostridium lundense TaxID=319475 RepID=UPI0004827559|nr:hypothetical protein [Clostridium lundense]